jgi:hypothetical protein
MELLELYQVEEGIHSPVIEENLRTEVLTCGTGMELL